MEAPFLPLYLIYTHGQDKQGTHGFSRFGISKITSFVDVLYLERFGSKTERDTIMDYGVQAFKDLILFIQFPSAYTMRGEAVKGVVPVVYIPIYG